MTMYRRFNVQSYKIDVISCKSILKIYDTSATPIKKIFSLLTAGKLQASYKQAGRKLKAN